MKKKNVWQPAKLEFGKLTCVMVGTDNYISMQPCRKSNEGSCITINDEMHPLKKNKFGVVKKLENAQEYPVAVSSNGKYLIGYKLKVLSNIYDFKFLDIETKECCYVMNPSIYDADIDKLYNVEDYFDKLDFLKGFEGVERHLQLARAGIRFLCAGVKFLGLAYYRDSKISVINTSGDVMFKDKLTGKELQIEKLDEKIDNCKNEIDRKQLQITKDEIIDREILHMLDKNKSPIKQPETER